MKFISVQRVSGLVKVAGFVSAAIITSMFTLVACTSTLTTVKIAPHSVANRLGFTGCSVSVPLSKSEVVEDAKRIGNPNPEVYPEWIAIIKNIQPGDQLRLVDCLNTRQSRKMGSVYFYALIRDHNVLLMFYPMIFD